MKVVEDKIMVLISKPMIETMIDHRAQELGIQCMHCGTTLRLPESYVSSYDKEVLDETIRDLQFTIKAVLEVSEKLYGRDLRRDKLVNSIFATIRKLHEPGLTVVK
jgi:hypothetical protein